MLLNIDQNTSNFNSTYNTDTDININYFYEINNKLHKLKEHIIQLFNNNDNKIYSDILTSLLKYIDECFNANDSELNDFNNIKNILINIETIISNYNESIEIKILLERFKNLTEEKLILVKKEYENNNSNNFNMYRKSDNLIDSKIIINKLQKELEIRRKEKNSIEIEKGMWERKAKALKNSIPPSINSNNLLSTDYISSFNSKYYNNYSLSKEIKIQLKQEKLNSSDYYIKKFIIF
jgi:hypothetical protein